MARYDVYRLKSNGVFVLDCQADLLRQLVTRFVVPLEKPELAGKPMRRLNPILTVDGTEMVMMTHLAAAVSVRDLSKPIVSLIEDDTTIGDAVDMLLFGF